MNMSISIVPHSFIHAIKYYCTSAFCIGLSRLEVPEQTLGGIPLGLGMVTKINFFEFSCMYVYITLLLLFQRLQADQLHKLRYY